MIRRPPRSTLFPYNDALPISSEQGRSRRPSAGAFSRSTYHHVAVRRAKRIVPHAVAAICIHARNRPSAAPGKRSEEHTSELQSHLNLVCRLLLEKKKKMHVTV